MLLKLSIMLWSNALDSSLIILHKSTASYMLHKINLIFPYSYPCLTYKILLIMNVTPVFLVTLQHKICSTQELFTNRSSKCLWNQPSSCIIVEQLYNHDYVTLKLKLKYETGATCWKSCLLCWHYAWYFVMLIMLKIM